jgi:hypothetical protein
MVRTNAVQDIDFAPPKDWLDEVALEAFHNIGNLGPLCKRTITSCTTTRGTR